MLLIALLFLQDAPDVDLRATLRTDGPKTKLRLEGRATLSDQQSVRILLYRLAESVEAGSIVQISSTGGFAVAPVTRKAYSADASVPGPGFYLAVAEIADQEDPPRWEFRLHMWNDEFVAALPKSAVAFNTLATEAIALIARTEEASASGEVWKKEAPAIERDGNKLVKQADGLSGTLPAAAGEVSAAVSNLLGTAHYLRWNDSGEREFFDYHTSGKAKTHRHAEFSFAELRKYIEEARAIAGRELGLWFVKEARRAKGSATALKAIRQIAEQPGFEPKTIEALFSEPADEARLAELEKELRSGKR
jgi:hypothetical protein